MDDSHLGWNDFVECLEDDRLVKKIFNGTIGGTRKEKIDRERERDI